MPSEKPERVKAGGRLLAVTSGFGLKERRVSAKRLAQRVWKEMDSDNVLGLAAQMSYYFALALFPFLIFLAALAGTLPSTDLWKKVLEWVTVYLPQDSQRMVFEAITKLMQGHGGFLSLGMIGTAWAASAGLMNLTESLNVVYEVKETRSIFKRTGIALLMLVVVAFSFVGSFVLLAAGDWMNEWLIRQLGFTAVLLGLWHAGRWVASVSLLAIGMSLVDYALPNLKRRWRWVTPGALFAGLLWLPCTLGINFYVSHVASYDKTYGTLATFVILMVWIYVLSLITLTGAEINSELWKMQAERESSPGRKPPQSWEPAPDDLAQRRAHGS